jgi:hypothetical protein
MKTLNRFYTYAYLREDRTPYYIGKGEGSRLYYKHKNEINPPKDKSRIIFLKQNLTEQEAFKHEIYMIAVFGRKDLGTGILRNRTNGGEGASGWVPNEETRKIISELKKGVNIGKKWWNDGCGNTKFSKECPGVNWVLGTSEETKRKKSESKKGKSVGKKWWNDGCGNTKFSKECPGVNWVLGMNKETKRKMSRTRTGIKWWNDGCGNHKKSVECPGEGWVSGMTKRKRIE